MPSGTADIFYGLSTRPGVEGTLIIQRESGSIIASTGVLASPRTDVPTQDSSSQPGDGEDRDGYNPTGKIIDSSEASVGPTTAQSVTRAVLQYVASAGELSRSVSAAIRQKESLDDFKTNTEGLRLSTPAASFNDSAKSSGDHADEIQLLRLRTSAHEIIIFPDSRFLCCVLQRIGGSLPSAGDSAASRRIL